jgi:hypothetical protein
MMRKPSAPPDRRRRKGGTLPAKGDGSAMIEIDLQENRGVVSLRPHPPLSRRDFVELAATVDPYLERHGRLKGLLILASAFPGWEDLAALREHLAFVSGHHRAICRVAVVSDSSAFRALPRLVRRFVDPEVEVFPENQRADAERWLDEADELCEPAGLRFLRFQARPLMWIEIDGRVRRDDYTLLSEAMEQQLAEGPPVSFLIRVRKFGGVDPGVVWDDLKFTLGHLNRIDRVALVGEMPFAHLLPKLSPLFPQLRLRHFSETEEDEAWQWLDAPNPAASG